MTARKLKLVPPEPSQERIDVTALLRSEIRRRDWAKVHIAADRRSPLFIADARKRTWLR